METDGLVRDAYEVFYSHSNFQYKNREIIGVFFDLEKATKCIVESSTGTKKACLSKIKVVKFDSKWCRVLKTGVDIIE